MELARFSALMRIQDVAECGNYTALSEIAVYIITLVWFDMEMNVHLSIYLFIFQPLSEAVIQTY